MPTLTHFILTIVIATVLGPLIGVVPFSVMSAWPGLSGARAWDIALSFGPLLLGAYFFGGVIAFIAGTIVAVVLLWRQPSPHRNHRLNPPVIIFFGGREREGVQTIARGPRGGGARARAIYCLRPPEAGANAQRNPDHVRRCMN